MGQEAEKKARQEVDSFFGRFFVVKAYFVSD